MAIKRATPNYVITYPLKVEKWQADIIDQRLELLRQIYNYAISHLMGKYLWLTNTKTFKQCKSIKEKQAFFNQNPCPMTFTQYGIANWVAKLNQRSVDGNRTFIDFGINGEMAALLGMTIWNAWDKYMFDSKCDQINKKRPGQINALGARVKSGYASGFSFDFEKMNISINVNGKRKSQAKYITMPIVTHKNQTEYELTPLKEGLKNIRIVKIAKQIVRGKRKYYLQLTVEGKVPSKGHELGKGRVGIDVGPQNIAICSDTRVSIERLAKDGEKDQKKIDSIRSAMYRSRKENNPNNFDKNGAYKPKEEHEPWNNTIRYMKLSIELKELYRRKAARIKLRHILLANDLLKLGNIFVVEDNPISEWKEKKGKTKGDTITSSQKCRKGWRRSITHHSPAMFINVLKNKVEGRGGRFIKVDCYNAATQYDFTARKFIKHGIQERYITLSDGRTHQRDIMAAFNLQHLNTDSKEMKEYNTEQMHVDYLKFCELEKQM